jgi:hypothetical protein
MRVKQEWPGYARRSVNVRRGVTDPEIAGRQAI